MRKKHTILLYKRSYLNVNKKGKIIILSEFCKVCRYNKKYAIRLLNKVQPKIRLKKIQERKTVYSSGKLFEVLKVIWLALILIQAGLKIDLFVIKLLKV